MTKTIPFSRTMMCAAALVVCTATTASAEETFSPYVSVFAGIGILGNETLTGIVTPPGGEQTVDGDYGAGFNVGAAVGVELGSLGFATPRVEIEGSYLSAGVAEDSLNFSGNGPGNEINVDGGISRALLLANFLLDFDTGGPITPYVGIGAGLAFTSIDVEYGGAPGGPAAVRVDDSGVELAGQLIAGASYAVTEDVSLFADGRYTRVFGFDGDRFNPAGLTGNISGDVDNLSVNVGVRYSF